MKNWKRMLSLTLGAVMVVGLLASCAKDEPAKSTPAASAPAASAPAASEPAASTHEKAAWPTGQVEIVVPAGAGGSQDIRARIVADYLQRNYGVTVVVNNMGEGNGVVGFEYVRNAKPDGSVLLYNYTGNIASMYHVGKYDYHPADAYTAISQTESWGAFALTAPADFPFDTLGEYVAHLKETGDSTTMGALIGSVNHMHFVVAAQRSGINMEIVEAQTANDKVAAMAGGFLDLTFLPVGTAAQYEESGDLKILCVLQPDRDSLYPDYETSFEQGVDWSIACYSRVYAPANMDPTLAAAISDALAGMKDDPTTVEQMENVGSTFIEGSSLCALEESQALIEADNQATKEAVEVAGYLVR